MDDQRRWEELDVDCLVTIFGRVGMESLLLDVPFVCKSWHKVSLNPSCWQSLVFPDLLDYDGEGCYDYGAFIERFLNGYHLDENCFSVTAFVKFVIDRSKGQATCLDLSPCASEDELKYAADECPALKTLALYGDLLDHGSSTIPELIGKWKHLESLVLGSSYYNFENLSFFSDICFHCKNLRHLRVVNADIGKDEAMAIVDFLPKLKELILRQANIDRDDLVTLLRGCKELVLLDVSDCEGFDEGDEEISKLASNIENFSSKGSTIIDNDYYYYEDGGSCNDQFGGFISS